jgi:hypothetical protein
MWQLISCALACATPHAETPQTLDFADCRLRARLLVKLSPERKAACSSAMGDVWTTDQGWVRRVRL